MNIKNQAAFSLTELSISVVIISILIAAVTTGVSLQKQAQIRAIAAEINIIQMAINNFKSQYNALPGDLANATTLWPSATTINGNGDNKISSNFYNSGSGDTKTEDTYVFQHLYLGGILPNVFTGGVQSTRYVRANNNIGNTYTSKLSNGAYSIFYVSYYSFPFSNMIEYGSFSSDSCLGHNNGGVMNPTDSYQLDLKMDDGSPNTGKLLTTTSCIGAANSCINSSNAYNFNNTSNTCKHNWILD